MGARLRWGLLVAVAACKAQLSDGPGADATRPPDARAIDAASNYTGLGAWSAPQTIPGADLGNAANSLDDPTVSSDELELIYSMTLSGGANSNFYVMTRATTADAWGKPSLITELSSASNETTPRLSVNDLTLYFNRAGTIYTATRAAIGQPWTTIAPLTEVNTGASQKWMSVCNGGYFMLSRVITGSTTGNDLYEGQLGTGPGTLVASLSSAYSDVGSKLSVDCLTLFFASTRADHTNSEIYMTTRATIGGAWSTPVLVNDFNLAGASQDDPWQSIDQRLFVFSRNSTAIPNALYYSTR